MFLSEGPRHEDGLAKYDIFRATSRQFANIFGFSPTYAYFHVDVDPEQMQAAILDAAVARA